MVPFCQYGAQDFFKSMRQYVGVGLVANLQRNRGHGQGIFIHAPPPIFVVLATRCVSNNLGIFLEGNFAQDFL